MKHSGDDGGLPGEDEGAAGDGFVEAAEEGVAAEENKEIEAEDGGAENERKGDGGVKEFPAAEGAVGEKPSEGEADEQRERRGQGGHAIPIMKGFTQDYVNEHYPGWSWSQLVNTLKRAGLYAKKEGHGARITEGFVGALVLAEGDGVAIGDDGSLKHWLKTERLASGEERSGRG